MTELDRGVGRRGVIDTFDESVGLGTISGLDGTTHTFHCIEIANGSRAIEPDTEVSFDLLAKFGRWEAANIRT